MIIGNKNFDCSIGKSYIFGILNVTPDSFSDGGKYSNVDAAPGNRPNTHSFAKKILGAKMGFPSFVLFKSDQSQLTIIQGYQSASDMVMMLWYFASGDNKRYPFEKYQQIFDKEIRPSMNEKLGIQ